MKVFVRSERGGWYLREDLGDSSKEQGKIEGPFPSYPDAVREASQRGHEINNLGWKRKLLTNVWLGHSLDGYPGWEVVRDEYPRPSPAFLKLSHVRGAGEIESQALCQVWDDVASEDFYQRDWTKDGIPFVRKGETYWSGWWFATRAERDRFRYWFLQQSDPTVEKSDMDSQAPPIAETIESPKAAPTPEVPAAPIPMIMNCPACGARHIDEGRFATHPHTTHSCQSCGVNFKPALVPTVGVEFLPGYQNQEGIVAEARKLRGLLSDLVSVVRCREDTGPALLAAELHLKKTDGMPDLQEIELYFNPRDPSGLTALVTRIVEVATRRVEMNPADEMDARFQVRDLLLAYAKEGRS